MQEKNTEKLVNFSDRFKKLMDETIAKAQTSGEAAKSYERWFNQPIPPKNMNMNFALSDDMKALFKAPNDQIAK